VLAVRPISATHGTPGHRERLDFDVAWLTMPQPFAVCAQ
jgi:hypothetical protein